MLELGLDVLLAIGPGPLPSRAAIAAKYGLWCFQPGAGPVARAELAGFWEVMDRRPVTSIELAVLEAHAPTPRVIHRSYVATDSRSVRRNRTVVALETSAVLLAKLRQLHAHGPAALATAAAAEPAVRSDPDAGPPTNPEMLRLGLRLAARYAGEKLERLTHFEQYFLAYSIAPGEPESMYRLVDLHFLIPPRDRYWADPFPLESVGGWFIFAEELLYRENRGRIVTLEVSREGAFSQPVVVLERDYHLSYPFVFTWQGKHYMIPETHQARRVELYEADDFPYRWRPHRILLDNVSAVDSTLLERDGSWWLFASILREGTLNIHDLHLFSAEQPLGPWSPHQQNPVKSDVRSSRPAGRIFSWNGSHYRPAQDLFWRYGYAVSINKIVVLNQEQYVEVEVDRISPAWAPGLLGTHTVNTCGPLTCLDGLRRVSRFGFKGPRTGDPARPPGALIPYRQRRAPRP